MLPPSGSDSEPLAENPAATEDLAESDDEGQVMLNIFCLACHGFARFTRSDLLAHNFAYSFHFTRN